MFIKKFEAPLPKIDRTKYVAFSSTASIMKDRNNMMPHVGDDKSLHYNVNSIYIFYYFCALTPKVPRPFYSQKTLITAISVVFAQEYR